MTVTAREILATAAEHPIVMLAPTRSRPRAAAELIIAFSRTTTRPHPQAALVLAVDDDDPALPEYRALDWPATIVGPRLRLGGTLNHLAPQAVDLGAEAVGFLGDDHRPRTPGWDTRLLDELRRLSPGVVYGDDGFQHERIPTAVVISAELIGRLGWMVPPGMTHLYLDDWWRTLGEDLHRLSYVPQVVIEHLHPAAGKGEWDAQYVEVNSAQMYAADGACLQAYLRDEWPATRGRLHAALGRAGAHR